MSDIKDILNKLVQALTKTQDLAKGINGDWQKEGYTLKISPVGFGRDMHTVYAYDSLGNKVGHAQYDTRPSKTGHLSVYNSEVDRDHQGKGLYQAMLNAGAEHAKSLGFKGLMSGGYQRSSAATRAWEKVATNKIDEGYETQVGIKQPDGSYKMQPYRKSIIDMYLDKSEEPLQKSPLMFDASDDPEQKPYVEVYRVENEHGEGPYHGDTRGGSKWWDKPHGIESDKNGEKKQPSPYEDKFNQQDIKALEDPSRHTDTQFGFESMDHLNQWFSPSELKRLAYHGFKPVKKKAKKVWSSGKQVFFIPHEEEKLAASEDIIEMPRKDFIKEHKKLVDVLKHPTKARIKDELDEQSSELSEELEKNVKSSDLQDAFSMFLENGKIPNHIKSSIAQGKLRQVPISEASSYKRTHGSPLINPGSKMGAPIIVAKYMGKNYVLDGSHRLNQAIKDGHIHIPIFHIDGDRTQWMPRYINRMYGVKKSESLIKAPIIAPDATNVSIGQDKEGNLDKKYKHIKSFKSNAGNTIHMFDDGSRNIFTITHDNSPSGKPISQLEVERDGEAGNPQEKLAWTHDAHRGKGLNYDLHKEAIKHFGQMDSDSTLSSNSNPLWEKLAKDPELHVELAPIETADPLMNNVQNEDAFSSHTARYVGGEKLAASEDLEKVEPPSHEGEIHSTHGYVAKMHPSGKLMWQNGPDIANRHDKNINDKKLKDQLLSQIKSPDHRKMMHAIINVTAKDPNRHFIPSQEDGEEFLRARHINNLLLGRGDYIIDTSNPNKLTITNPERHGTDPKPTKYTFDLSLFKGEDYGKEYSDRDYDRRGNTGTSRDVRSLRNLGRERAEICSGSSGTQNKKNNDLGIRYGKVTGRDPSNRSSGSLGKTEKRVDLKKIKEILEADDAINVEIPEKTVIQHSAPLHRWGRRGQ